MIFLFDSFELYNFHSTNIFNFIIHEYDRFKKRKETEPLQLLQPKLTALVDLKNYDINNLDKRIRNNIRSTETNGLELEIADATKIDILYNFVKYMKDRSVNYYRNFYNSFKKSNQADLLLVKVNYE